MSSRHEAHLIERELDILQLLHLMNGTLTEFVATVRGMQVNGILFSGAGQIPANGVWTKDFVVPYAYVHVVNLGADQWTVTNDAAQSVPPGLGGQFDAPIAEGVKYLPGGASLGFNLAGRILTIYGTPGDRFNVEVHIKPERSGG